MLNAERFKEKINKYNNEFGLTDNIVDCRTLDCKNCRFSRLNNSDDEIILCSTRKVKWLLSEYKEPVKLTRLEYEVLKHYYNDSYKYIARDENGDLFLYIAKPSKGSNIWRSISDHHNLYDFRKKFQFVKFEDEEPTSIKDILENCEVIEDAEE